MGKECCHKKKSAIAEPSKKTDEPFPFLQLLPELRRLVYQHHFSNLSVIIDEYDPDDDDKEEIDEEVAEYRNRATHMHQEDTDGESDSDDDPESTDNMDFHDREIARDGAPSPAAVQNWIKYNWRVTLFEECGPFRIHSGFLARVGVLLLTCKQIKDEAQPMFAASIHLKVVTQEYEIRNLPEVVRRLYLSKIQKVTLCSNNDSVNPRARGEHYFDVRQMAGLKTLYFEETPLMHTKYTFADVEVQKLVAFIHGDKDEVFIQDLLAQGAKVTKWETDFIAKEQPPTQQVIRQKNAVRYWLRQLMLNPSQRKFRIIYRRHLTLVMQLLAPKSYARAGIGDRIPNLAERRVFLDLDIDIDTKQVMRRHIAGTGGLDLSDKADLIRWIKNHDRLEGLLKEKLDTFIPGKMLEWILASDE